MKIENKIRKILMEEETEDVVPPYRCLPPINKMVVEIKTKRICNLINDQLNKKDQ